MKGREGKLEGGRGGGKLKTKIYCAKHVSDYMHCNCNCDVALHQTIAVCCLVKIVTY